MKSTKALLLAFLCLLPLNAAFGQNEIAKALQDPALDMSKPADREKAAKQIKAIQEKRKAAAVAKARALGLPIREEGPDGQALELMDFEGEHPLYYQTTNLEAATITTADKLQSSPYNLDGSGILAGIWDSSPARASHQEFGGRLVAKDGSSSGNHATHCAGTIGAAGVDTLSKGMAANVSIDSYEWNNDISEIASRAATTAGELGTQMSVSNQSYVYVKGWNGNKWSGTGTDQNAYNNLFGRYTATSVNIDSIANNAPYYLGFWSSGNDGVDNPSTGSSVTIGGSTYAYDPAIHPPGDGVYRGGFDTLGPYGVSKNVMTVASVKKAVTSGQRNLTNETTVTIFSSIGPTDDGRIKPDILADGKALYSPIATSDSAYASYTGTSMAAPNACGSAVLLIDHYKTLFPNQAMRASTLKGLILHTASDLGNPGPDYKHGWGLMDCEKAAQLLDDHAANPGNLRLTEAELSTTNTSDTYSFNWDGSSAIRATICWTDPAGTSTNSHDDRTPRLVNDLNIKIIAPDGTEYFPYVMPFVGTWTQASMDLPATTGVNTTDNVEQVYIEAPGQSGQWQVVVTHNGALTNNVQQYGLLIDGSGVETLSNHAPVWASNPVSEVDATEAVAYISSLTDDANDADGDSLSFAKVNGPAWLNVAANGTLSGTPGAGDLGANSFTVSVSDGIAPAVEATLNIMVLAPPNNAPLFIVDPISGLDAIEDSVYAATLEGTATDADSDPLTYAKVSGPAWLSVAATGDLDGTPTNGDLGLNSFTVSVSDGKGGSDTASLEITVFPAGSGTADYALSELTTSGTVVGTISDLDLSDNSYQQLTEVASGGKPSRRHSILEHQWTFEVLGGDLLTFIVEAHHDANAEGDDFVFAYSLDGVNYTDMMTVTKTADDNVQQSFTLPAGTNGTIHVRVTDTDRTAGNSQNDTLYIDEMYFLSEPVTEAPGVASAPTPADGATAVTLSPVLTWEGGLLAASHNVYFGTNPTLGAEDFQGNLTEASFSPGNLTPNTTYYWAVDEVNGTGTTSGPTWSFTTGAGMPEMHVASIVLDVQKAGRDHKGVAHITVVESATGLPVIGATVSGDFGGAFSESASAVTDNSGVATITTSAKARLPMSFTFTVTDVTEDAYDYNAANNFETSESGSF